MADVTATSWMNQKKWASGRIKSSNKSGLLFIGFFAAVWNAVSWTICLANFDQIRSQGGEKLIALFFPLVGIIAIGVFVYQLMRQLRFGTSVFEMQPQPGVIGGKVGGVIHVPKHLEPENGFELILNCIHRYTTGTGKNRSTHEAVKWQDRKVIERELLANDLSCSAIPVLFGVPYDAQETTVVNGDGYLWRLEAKAELAGVDYYSRFDIPVFLTESSNPDFQPESVVVSGYEKTVSPEDMLASSRLLLEPLGGGGLRCTCPMFRGIGTGIMLFLMSAVFMGVAYWIAAPLFFRGIAGAVGLGIFYGGLDLLFWKSQMEVSLTGLYLQSGLFGLKGQRINRDEIESIAPAQGCTTNNRVWYVLKLKTVQGKSVTLAKGLTDERSARALGERLMREMNQGS